MLSSDSSTIEANASDVLAFWPEATTTYPSPSVAPTNSPTTEPITSSVIPTFRPTKTYGRAAGNRTLTNCWSCDADSEWTRSTSSAGVDRRPVAVLITIGKKQISTTIATFGPAPKPIQITSSGAIAIFGIAFRATSAG